MLFSKTLHIFTYHNHLFEVAECDNTERKWHELRDEHGLSVEIEDASLPVVGQMCRSVVDEYARALEERTGGVS